MSFPAISSSFVSDSRKNTACLAEDRSFSVRNPSFSATKPHPIRVKVARPLTRPPHSPFHPTNRRTQAAESRFRCAALGTLVLV